MQKLRQILNFPYIPIGCTTFDSLTAKVGLGKSKTIKGFTKDIEQRPFAVAEFDEKLWLAIIDMVTVCKDGTMVFKFRNGTEIAM